MEMDFHSNQSATSIFLVIRLSSSSTNETFLPIVPDLYCPSLILGGSVIIQ